MKNDKEIALNGNAFLITETDAQGNIIFANEEFCHISGYSQKELLGQSHNIVKHEDMPNEIFQELWETICSDEVWQGYMKNKTRDGNYYWVYSTIYPYTNTKDEKCYMSIRRKASKEKIEKIQAVYKNMI